MKKTAEIMRFQRFVGCGRRTRTSDLQVMSCSPDVVLAPVRASVPFLLGTKIRFKPLCSVDSVWSEPRIGHGLGQAEVPHRFLPQQDACTEGTTCFATNLIGPIAYAAESMYSVH